jgi:bacterioferritin-associated ferredoxin
VAETHRPMIVCSCNVISDKTVRDIVKPCGSPAACARDVFRSLGCTPKCGRCVRRIQSLFEDNRGVSSPLSTAEPPERAPAEMFAN